MSRDNSRSSMAYRKADNEAKLCKVCERRHRQNFSPWCSKCSARRTKYGIPTGAHLPRVFYAAEYAETVKFLRRFRQHQSVIEAEKFFDEWLRAAQLGHAVPGAKSVARLSDRGHTGALALQEVLSVALYQSRRQTAATSAPFLFAIAFLRSAPGAKRGPQAVRRVLPLPALAQPGFKERKEISDTIRKMLRSMIYEMLEWYKRMDALHNAQAKGLSESFPALCERCAYNETKAREKRKARRKKSGLPHDVDGRSREARAARGQGPGNPAGVNGSTKKTKGAASGETKEDPQQQIEGGDVAG